MSDPVRLAPEDVARELWYWALWLNREMNAAFEAEDMADLEARRTDPRGMALYERWRTVRESYAKVYPWLKERP